MEQPLHSVVYLPSGLLGKLVVICLRSLEKPLHGDWLMSLVNPLYQLRGFETASEMAFKLRVCLLSCFQVIDLWVASANRLTIKKV